VQGAGRKTFTGARNWDESEYCSDANTGTLTTYSPAPGLFVHYDYSAALKFHGKTIPGAFTITEAGRAVIEAKTVSLTEPPATDTPLFNPAGFATLGTGRLLTPTGRIHSGIGIKRPAPANTAIQVVVLHGMATPDGHLRETEILASSDPNINQFALQQVNAGGYLPPRPGATPQSREMFYTLEFETATR
jgi:hypothetical protein